MLSITSSLYSIIDILCSIGISIQSRELTWGSHINKSFIEVIEAAYEKDRQCLDTFQVFHSNQHIIEFLSGTLDFMYPFGLCSHYVEYDPHKDLEFQILNTNDYAYESMYIFITDPLMMTHSSIDQQSHQGIQLFGLKKGHNTIYSVEVTVKDLNNPTERDSCSSSSYADCVNQKIQDIFSKVMLESNK